MATVYVIDDQFVKNNYPSLSSYNDTDILSVIMIEQKSSLVNAISKDVYESMIEYIESDTLDGDWVELLELCQDFMLFSTVKAMFDLYEKDKDGYSRDNNVANLYGKIKWSERNIKKFIEESTDIEPDDDYSSDYYTGSPIYYPR